MAREVRDFYDWDDELEENRAVEKKKDYDELSGNGQAVIDAALEDLSRSIQEVASAADVTNGGARYVLVNHGYLLKEVDNDMRRPVAVDVQGETKEALLSDGGMEHETVSVELTEREAFQAIKRLPNELAEVIYTQLRGKQR